MYKSVIRLLTSPAIMFYLIPWLMVLVVLGTISQRYIGLYESQRLFFTSFILWLGPVPTPGMYSILVLLGISLTLKLIYKSPARKINAGTLMTHLGALLLLVGALITAISSTEGAMTLRQGEANHFVTDYTQRQLVIQKAEATIASFDLSALQQGDVISDPALPFKLQLHQMIRDATIEACAGNQQQPCLIKNPISTIRDEDKRMGLTLSMAGSAAKNKQIVYENSLYQPSLTFDQVTYQLVLQKTRRVLPFSVRLDRFEKFLHPATNIAREYESIVTIKDGELEFQSPIRMNEPLRYRGYTFYQSSFLMIDDIEYSVLAVVKNTGRVFPYISSLVMCLGLLIHLILRRKKKGL